jgi:hypothetical protein
MLILVLVSMARILTTQLNSMASGGRELLPLLNVLGLHRIYPYENSGHFS